jgi:metal-responsive CopG/Arc/MetJ family transcriptional regulator
MRRTEWKKPVSFTLAKHLFDELKEMAEYSVRSRTEIVEEAIHKLYKSWKRKLNGA